MTAAFASGGAAGVQRAGPMRKDCAVCKAPDSPWGLRWPGSWSRLPPEKRRFLWACSPACLDALEERLEKAAVVRLPPRTWALPTKRGAKPDAAAAPRADAGPGDLFALGGPSDGAV